MASKDLPIETLKQQILALDDKIELLVASLDPDAPDSHAAVYAEIEQAHQLIFALRDQLKKQEAKG